VGNSRSSAASRVAHVVSESIEGIRWAITARAL
jgi:hypothetical protein